MYINVRINPRARETKVEQLKPDYYRVYVKAAPIKNKANLEMIEVLAEYFNVKRHEITLVNGASSREKLIRIGD